MELQHSCAAVLTICVAAACRFNILYCTVFVQQSEITSFRIWFSPHQECSKCTRLDGQAGQLQNSGNLHALQTVSHLHLIVRQLLSCVSVLSHEDDGMVLQ